MTLKQLLLKRLYPTIMKFSQKGEKGKVLLKPKSVQSSVQSESLQIELSNGDFLQLNELKGKKVLLVNTASDCGYTGQFEELQHLQNLHKDSLAIVGFPANDFLEQEKGEDSSILNFCQVNYGVTFPIAKKSVVIKKANQNLIFEWLSNPSKNGWNNQEPVWNFSKYLLSETGELLGYFGPAISPNDKRLMDLITT
jgi:glutathione peroxidase